ncbi:MAG TPA: hypothetical protein VFA04_04200 [Bryobacteraceae bacterium]|nr:hypothetical protein [Bryobacteraceae bacterium]
MQVANAPPPDAASNAPPVSARFLASAEGELALVVIGLGVVVIIGLSIVLKTRNGSPDDAIRGYAITLIIVGTMVLICAGYSNDQIAPAMGLFGTLAGYLLGRKGGQQ